VIKRTPIRDEFEARSQMLEGCRADWPAILSSLKSVVEAGSH
jgi:hypothetical protein